MASLQTEPIPNDGLPFINRPATIVAVTITFQVLAWIAVSFRIFARFWLAHSPGWDDFFVILATIIATVGTGFLCLSPSEGGLGQHQSSLSPDDLIMYFKLLYANNALYILSTTLVKVSILFQYLRLFTPQHHPRVRRFCLVMLGITSVWGLAFFFGAVFSCTPIKKAWDILDTVPGTCILFASRSHVTFFAAFTGHAASNTLLDTVILGIPIPYWRYLARDNKSKAALFGLFGIGSIVVSISVARLAVISVHRAGTYPELDLTWYGPPIFITSVLEVQVATVCASIPIFWPIIERLSMGNILVVNEISVRSESQLERRKRDIEDGNFSEDSTSSELQHLPSAFQKEGVLAGWHDPLGDDKDEPKLRPFSARVEPVEPPIREIKLFKQRTIDEQ